ncbi:MAG: DUF5723 family protein [Dysgonamonadaceae bacterium]|nr:DUF5723 family protein [Dysgonamonadaceae bacterium]
MKIAKYIKLQLLVILAIISLSAMSAMAQSVQSAYFMETVPGRLNMNPALRPSQGYVGFPGLGNVYVSMATNTLNINHLYFTGRGPIPVLFMNENVGVDEFLNKMADNNYLSGDFGETLLSAGWYSGKGFWFFDIGTKGHFETNIPKSMFEFAKGGFSDTEDRSYNLKNTNALASGYLEIGLGHSHSFLDDNLLIGLKAKFLLGVADANFNIDDLSITGGPTAWKASSKATLRGAGAVNVKYKPDGKFDTIELDEDNLFGFSGYGLGFDIGGAYHFKGMSDMVSTPAISDILSKLTISMSFTDIGFISWSKKHALELTSPATDVTLTSSMDVTGMNFEEMFNQRKDELFEAIDLQSTDDVPSYSTSLRTTMNWGLEYELMPEKISLGLLSSTYFNHHHTMSELTLSGNFRPAKWLATTLSYSFVNSNFRRFGLALHIAPSRGLNFFVASDYLIPYISDQVLLTTSRGINAQVGLTIPIGERR